MAAKQKCYSTLAVSAALATAVSLGCGSIPALYAAPAGGGAPRLAWQTSPANGAQRPAQTGQVRECDEEPGADASIKINNCIAALPANGGIADARGLTGAQTGSQTIMLGAKPVVLLLGAVDLVSTANPAIEVNGFGPRLTGIGSGSSVPDYGAVASVIQDTTPGAPVVVWQGRGGTLADLKLMPTAADGLDLAAGAATGDVMQNRFQNLFISCSNETHDAVHLSGYNGSGLVSFNIFLNLVTLNCLNGVHEDLARGGTQGPTDNQFYGGILTKNQGLAGDGFRVDYGADTLVEGMDIAGNAQGIYLGPHSTSHTFVQVTNESNAADIVCEAGGADHAFYGGTGQITDNCTRTTYQISDNSSGPRGSTAWYAGTAFTHFALNNHGWGTILRDSATAPRTISFPDASGQVALITNLPVAESLETSANATDTVALPGVTPTSYCAISPTNSAAASALTSVYVSSKSSGEITVTHPAQAGMRFDIVCTAN